jgi:hypothetical protein
MMSKLASLEAMVIVGNAFDDRPLLALAHEIMVDEDQPMRDRIRALAKMDRAIGLTGPLTPAAVRRYVMDHDRLLGRGRWY